jgi:hypothetical protein
MYAKLKLSVFVQNGFKVVEEPLQDGYRIQALEYKFR